MKLDVLILTAHPDDAEYAMGGTILKLLAAGKKIGIADFTRGELGTRGTAEIRLAEAEEADRRMGLTTRVNLGFRDGFFVHDEYHTKEIIKLLRRFRPEIVFSNPHDDRHPDHGRVYDIVNDAIFLSGLCKIEIEDAGAMLDPWRPEKFFQYIQAYQHEPQFVVDIGAFWERKIHVLRAYESQFSKKDGCSEPDTILTRDNFWNQIEAQARVMGHKIDVDFGEGFLSRLPLKIGDVMGLV